MAISSATSKNQYTANGVNVAYTYTFKIFDQDDIKVITTDTSGVETVRAIGAGATNYSVSGVGADAGGTVTFVTAPTNLHIVTLKRNEPLTQEIEYVEGDDFPAASHEEGLDRSAIRDQFLQEQIDRTITLPESSTATLSFADPTGNGGKYLSLNSAADEVEYVAVVGTLDGVAIAGGDAAKPIVVNATEDGFEVGSGKFLTDGDKGDITVSASGATWNVIADLIAAKTSAGMVIEASNGTDVALLGAGNTANSTFYGSVSMNTTNKIVNMADPISAQDAATKAYVDAAGGTDLTGRNILAWVNFNGTGVVAIRDGYNVSSITDNGVGDYTVNFTSSVANANYATIVVAGMTGTGAGNQCWGSYKQASAATGSVGVRTGNGGGFLDSDNVSVLIIGD